MIDLKKIEWLTEMLKAEIQKQLPGVESTLTIDLWLHKIDSQIRNRIVQDLKKLGFTEGGRDDTKWVSRSNKENRFNVFTGVK